MEKYFTFQLKKLKSIYKKIPLKNIKFEKINKNTPDSTVPPILKSLTFVSPYIREIIKKKYSSHEYKITYVSNEFNIEIKYYDKINKKDKEFIQKIITRLIFFCKMTKNNFKNKNNFKENIKITIWPTNEKKTLPSHRGDIITEDNVNGGCTFVNSDAGKNGNNSEIFIWRKEELLKVLLHEASHSFGLDSLLIFDKIGEDYNKQIENFFCVDNGDKFISVNEVYTEILATLYNCLFVSIETTNTDMKNPYKLFQIEKTFITTQMSKILWHYEYKSFKDILRSNHCVPFKQRTNVLSYFILKCCFFNNEDELKNFIIDGTFILQNVCCAVDVVGSRGGDGDGLRMTVVE